jgi:hypothetical protein
MIFSFEIFCGPKIMFQVSQFEIQNFQKILDGKTTRIKIIDLDNIYNFLVQIFHSNSFTASNIHYHM